MVKTRTVLDEPDAVVGGAGIAGLADEVDCCSSLPPTADLAPDSVHRRPPCPARMLASERGGSGAHLIS